MEQTSYKFPSEMVTLPSKGLLYPEDSPLRKGEIEMKYMTAREEDILTNQNLIQNGTVIDKLLQALIITPINYNDLLVGDKNAIMVAARILAYGKEYKVAVQSLLTEWLIFGQKSRKFELEFAEHLGKDYGVLTNSGSSANLLMVSALKSKKLRRLKKYNINLMGLQFLT